MRIQSSISSGACQLPHFCPQFTLRSLATENGKVRQNGHHGIQASIPLHAYFVAPEQWQASLTILYLWVRASPGFIRQNKHYAVRVRLNGGLQLTRFARDYIVSIYELRTTTNQQRTIHYSLSTNTKKCIITTITINGVTRNG